MRSGFGASFHARSQPAAERCGSPLPSGFSPWRMIKITASIKVSNQHMAKQASEAATGWNGRQSPLLRHIQHIVNAAADRYSPDYTCDRSKC
jgi:hypothetical protein